MNLVLPFTDSGQVLVSAKPVNEFIELTDGDEGSNPSRSTKLVPLHWGTFF